MHAVVVRFSQPSAPFHPTPRGRAVPNLLAQSLFEKYGQHQPLNRQATCYDEPEKAIDDTALVAAMARLPMRSFYGYRRTGAALRQKGLVVNSKKVRRLMRAHGLNPKQTRPSRHNEKR